MARLRADSRDDSGEKKVSEPVTLEQGTDLVCADTGARNLRWSEQSSLWSSLKT